MNFTCVFGFVLSLLLTHAKSWTLWDPPVGCTVFPYVKAPLCSGHGICVLIGANQTRTIITQANVPNSECLCDPNWSGINDFVNMSTHDCGQNLIVLRVFYALIMISAIREIFFILQKLHTCYAVYYEQKELSQEYERDGTTTESVSDHHSKSHPISVPNIPSRPPTPFTLPTTTHSSPDSRSPTPPPFDPPPFPANLSRTSSASRHHPKTAVTVASSPSSSSSSSSSTSWRVMLEWRVVRSCLVALLSGVTLFVFTFIRLIEPRSVVIGTSVVGSFCLLLWDISFLIAERGISFSWLKVRNKLVRLTAKHKTHAKQAIRRLRRSLYVAYAFDVTRTVAIILIHIYPQHASIFSCYFHSCAAGSLIISSTACIQAGKALDKILVDGLEMLTGVAKEERERALMMVRGVVAEMKRTAFMPLIMAIIVGYWPFMRSHLSYFCVNVIITTFVLCSHLNAMQPPRTHASKRKDTVRGEENNHATKFNTPTFSSAANPASPSTTPQHSAPTTPMVKGRLLTRSMTPTFSSKTLSKHEEGEGEGGEGEDAEEKMLGGEIELLAIRETSKTITPLSPSPLREVSYSRRVHSHSKELLDSSTQPLTVHPETMEEGEEDENEIKGKSSRRPTLEEIFYRHQLSSMDQPRDLGIQLREPEDPAKGRGTEEGGLEHSMSNSALDSSSRPFLFSHEGYPQRQRQATIATTATAATANSQPSSAEEMRGQEAPILESSSHEDLSLLPIFNPFQ